MLHPRHQQVGAGPAQPSDGLRGIVVQPGDLILGDDDGMVIVERQEAESVLEKALKRVEAEEIESEQLRSGVSSVELNKLGTIFAALDLVEE
jgi:4-hydroxy-4-methyl-2-oxoglutarate aldolase